MVYHMEIDLLHPDQILFAERDEIKVTDGETVSTLVGGGNDRGKYKEGVGTAAVFNSIRGFSQINETFVLIVDWGNHCLRAFDRVSLETSPFAGQCRSIGFRDGPDALFKLPWSVVSDARVPNMVFVADYGNRAVRQVNLENRLTSTLFRPSTEFNGQPYEMAFDVDVENLLVTVRENSHARIFQYSFASQTLTAIAGGLQGFRNGPLGEAQFRSLSAIAVLSSSLNLVGDQGNDRLRVLNSADGVVGSICRKAFFDPKPGSSDTCQLYGPYSLLVTNGRIFVGDYLQIFTVQCE